MAFRFTLESESVKRWFAVYVVVIKSSTDVKLYVGKTGDNRDGCNPVISRCGNHFSYNDIHSQIRNKVDKHEDFQYIYVFDHFTEYIKGNKQENTKRRQEIDEMERWLNEEINSASKNAHNISLINPLKGTGVSKKVKEERTKLRTDANAKKILEIVSVVKRECNIDENNVNKTD